MTSDLAYLKRKIVQCERKKQALDDKIKSYEMQIQQLRKYFEAYSRKKHKQVR